MNLTIDDDIIKSKIQRKMVIKPLIVFVKELGLGEIFYLTQKFRLSIVVYQIPCSLGLLLYRNESKDR